MEKLWKCPKCKREFAKKGQAHSCTIYPLSKHFKNKDFAQELYDDLLGKLTGKSGKVKIESLPCCIHFVSTHTFAGVYAMKDRIRIHLALHRKINSRRISQFAQIAANRFQYSIDVFKKSEIDSELIGWLEEARA